MGKFSWIKGGRVLLLITNRMIWYFLTFKLVKSDVFKVVVSDYSCSQVV